MQQKSNTQPLSSFMNEHSSTLWSESTLYNCLNINEALARNKRDIWTLGHCNGNWTHNHLVPKRTRNHLAKLPNIWAVLWELICTVHLTVCYYHVTLKCVRDMTYSPSYNLIPSISRVLIGQHLIFCSLTSPTCCNSPRKCTPVKYKKRQKAGFSILL